VTRPSGPAAAEPSAAAIAEDLRARIHRGELGPGDRLPAERELAEQLGVGRPRVREALAELEAGGYVVTRRGAAGGRFVTELRRPYQRWKRRMARDLAELEDMLDLRVALERQVAVLAAERRTDDDLKALRRAIGLLAAADNPRAYRNADTAFHDALATASGSRRLAEAVARARGELFEPIDELWFDERADDSLAAHRAILDAVADRDADRAAAAMTAHLEQTRREVRELLAGSRTAATGKPTAGPNGSPS
jgi:DNA-binding FadR family transcriptional regulator